MVLGHENRIVGGLCLVLVVTFSVAYAQGAIPSVAALVPAGTVFPRAAIQTWVIHIVAPSGGRIIGAAAIDLPSEDSGLPGYWGLGLAPGIQLGPSVHSCPAQPDLPRTSEILNVSFLPGVYTVYWDSCLTYLPTAITVTVTIVLLP